MVFLCTYLFIHRTAYLISSTCTFFLLGLKNLNIEVLILLAINEGREETWMLFVMCNERGSRKSA